MGAVILEPPGRVEQAPDDLLVEEQLMLDVANLRHVPDWEDLMQQGATPALILGAERRSNPR